MKTRSSASSELANTFAQTLPRELPPENLQSHGHDDARLGHANFGDFAK